MYICIFFISHELLVWPQIANWEILRSAIESTVLKPYGLEHRDCTCTPNLSQKRLSRKNNNKKKNNKKKMYNAAKWCEYLVSGVKTLKQNATIYHMCEKKSWEEQIEAKGTYTPPTFETDGFVHATVCTPIVIH